MACHWKPLCHLTLESKSADLSPGLWQKSIFPLHTPLSCSRFTDTWLSQLVDVRCLAVRWTHGCPYWWITGLGHAMIYLPSCLLRLVTGNWSSWNFSLTIRWHLGSWVPAFPWGSIISGFGHHHLRYWMLISLSAVWCWRSVVWLRHFSIFLLRCAVFDSMIAVFYSLCSSITHIVVLIMLPLLFTWSCWCLFCCVFCRMTVILILRFSFSLFYVATVTWLQYCVTCCSIS